MDENWSIVREAVGEGRLSVVMPLYNLAAETEANMKSVVELFESNGVNAELVPVDDGSGDGTGAVLARLPKMCAKCRHVTMKPVVCRRNGGKGAALSAGF